DFNALDTWFLSLILEDIIANIKGPATGTGVIFGNGENLTYHADLQLQDIFIKPAFVNTRWHLNGPVQLSSDSGVDINNVDITDENGGTGTLYGNVDLKNENGTYLDLHLRLNNLKAMNSPFGPDMPFYGDLSASGTLNLVGPTDDLRLYSTENITIQQNSKVGIPLITGTQLTEANKFIKFVESFDKAEQKLNEKGEISGEEPETGQVEENEELSFSERVDIDLQFRAPEPVNVTLLFDPTTGEKLKAEGTGNIRLVMEGGNVQLFGRFDVTGGTYHFVTGQIFQRELEIRSGGSIDWTGDPEGARLNNVEAVYQARPEN